MEGLMATKLYKRIEVGKYDIPIEALALAEDIVRLEQVCSLLERIDPVNCSEEKQTGVDSHSMMRSMAHLCRQAAERKLRKIFLAK